MGKLSENFSVYAPDLIGHGDSDKPDLNYLISDHARCIIEFMDAVKIKKARIIGSSIGSMISIDMSANFPDRVLKQVLVACPSFMDRWKIVEDLLWLGSRYDADGNPIPQMLENMKFIYANPTQEITDWTNRLKNTAGKWCRRNQVAIAIYDPRDLLGRIVCPTLVVYGVKDALITSEEFLVKMIKDAKAVRIDNASHFPSKEQPEAFLDAVLNFL